MGCSRDGVSGVKHGQTERRVNSTTFHCLVVFSRELLSVIRTQPAAQSTLCKILLTKRRYSSSDGNEGRLFKAEWGSCPHKRKNSDTSTHENQSIFRHYDQESPQNAPKSGFWLWKARICFSLEDSLSSLLLIPFESQDSLSKNSDVNLFLFQRGSVIVNVIKLWHPK